MSSELPREMESLIPQLRAFARKLTRDEDRADDLVQHSLERALRRLHQFQPGTNLRAWMFTILRNAHINELRRRSKWVGSMDATACEDLFPSPAGQTAHVEMNDVWRAMSNLSEQDRRILLLVGAEGHDYQEAAGILDVAVGTIRSRLSRARTRLRAALGVERDGTAISAAA